MKATPYFLAAPAALLLVLFLAAPLFFLVRLSLCEPPAGQGFYRPGTWTLQEYAEAASPYTVDVFSFTLALGVGVAAVCLLLAYPLALFLIGLPARLRSWALLGVLLPKLASVLVVIYGLQLILSSTGPVNRLLLALGMVHEPLLLTRNRIGVVIGEVYLILPYAVLVLVTALERIDPALVPAARGLGATAWQAFWRITLPLSLPGAVLAGQLCLVWGVGAFLGPLLLGGPNETTLSVEVHRQAFEYNNWPRGAVTAVLLLLTAGSCLALMMWPVRAARRVA
jgi:ABC-type spermidine/putrescine transport system permease subunit I